MGVEHSHMLACCAVPRPSGGGELIYGACALGGGRVGQMGLA
jgi:hypothetical protein